MCSGWSEYRIYVRCRLETTSPGDGFLADSYVTADYTAAAELTSTDLYWTAARPRTRCVIDYKFTALDGSASE